MSRRFAFRARWLFAIAASVPFCAAAAPEPEVLRPDLDSAIAAAVRHPAQFAVNVPVDIRPESRGEWTTAGAYAVWRYSLQVEQAPSISFHADQVALPAGTTLRLSGGGRQFSYDRSDFRDGELWSDLLAGDTLDVELVVPAERRSGVRLRISGVQVGFRSLLPGFADHPSFEALRRAAQAEASADAPAGSLNASLMSAACAQNYQCFAEPALADQAAATMAIVISNMFLCTGTLINDVPESRTPHVLLARHCQGGSGPGGDPGAASDMRFYWGAVTPCGVDLASVFDSSTQSQVGAQTRVEQEDLWLVRMSSEPLGVAAFAGWDATGSTFNGGFTTHHAVGLALQYTEWFAAPHLATFVTPWYTSRVWRTVNQLGNIGHGASGSAFFDPTGRTVGVLSRGTILSSNTDDYGVCPASPLLPATASRWAGEFVAIGPLWDSTADTSSQTNPNTLRTELDPEDTGVLVVDKIAAAPRVTVNLSADPHGGSIHLGADLLLSWTTENATSCTASGGGPGSTWAGSRPTSGSVSVTESVAGHHEYTLTCSNGSRSQTDIVGADWIIPPALIELTATPPGRWAAGMSVTLTWTSNVTPCVASGGVAGDGWAGSRSASGSHVVHSSVPATVAYEITCGSSPRIATRAIEVNWQDIFAFLFVNEPSIPAIRVGQFVTLRHGAAAASCTGTGGSPGDGWAGPKSVEGEFELTSNVAGTFTYRYQCVAGPNTAQAEVTLTWTDGPPAASLTATPLRARLGATSATRDRVWLEWLANVEPCRLDFSGPTGNGIVSLSPEWRAVRSDQRSVPGIYTYTVSCGSGNELATASVDVEWYVPPAEVNLEFQPTPTQPPVYGPDGAELRWVSTVAPCVATGGATGDGWAGNRAGGSQSAIVRPPQPGTYTYVLTCGPPGNQATDQVTLQFAPPPAPVFDYFEAFPANAVTGDVAMLRWRARYATSCTASGGYPGDHWAGPRSVFDDVFVGSPVPGPQTYRLTCSNAAGSTIQDVAVNWSGALIAFATLNITPTTVTIGQSFVVSWSSERAASCTAAGGMPNDGWQGVRLPMGDLTVQAQEIGWFQYSIQCGNSRHVSVNMLVVPAAAPVIALTMNPVSVPLGESANLSWNVTGASSCEATGGTSQFEGGAPWHGTQPSSGSITVRPRNRGTWPYTLTCTSPGNLTQSTVQVTVTDPVNPVVEFAVAPSSVTVGSIYRISWNVDGATACSASGGVSGDGWTGVLAFSGQITVVAATVGTHLYGIDCVSGTGMTSVQQSMTINAAPPPPPPGGGGGGGGGGGSTDLAALAALAALGFRRRRRTSLH